MWRQTSGWVTCAKPSRRNTYPGVSDTLSPCFLKQNYPKYVSDVASKILEKKKTIIRCFVWICDLPEIGSPVLKVENVYCQFFSCFTEPIRRIFSMLSRWPVPIYMRVGYVIDSLFSEWKIQPISTIFCILNKW